jgi:hypothetical protein
MALLSYKIIELIDSFTKVFIHWHSLVYYLFKIILKYKSFIL